MTAVPPAASSHVVSGSASGPDAAPVSGPILTPPVTVGPIAASSLGGIPFIAINSPVHHYSGKRLTQFILAALTEVGVTVEVPD